MSSHNLKIELELANCVQRKCKLIPLLANVTPGAVDKFIQQLTLQPLHEHVNWVGPCSDLLHEDVFLVYFSLHPGILHFDTHRFTKALSVDDAESSRGIRVHSGVGVLATMLQHAGQTLRLR